jgi:hypothetical protein
MAAFHAVAGESGVLDLTVVLTPGSRHRSEAVKKLGQAPSPLPIFQGFRRFGSEPVPFFYSRSGREPERCLCIVPRVA